jgi:ABC-type glycerol-3-phosphate transport system permease component
MDHQGLAVTLLTEAPSASHQPIPAESHRDRNIRWIRDHRLPSRVLIIFALVVLALSAVFPLYFMVQAALRTQAQWNQSEMAFPTSLSLSTLKQVWMGGDVGVFLRNSTVITVGSTVLSIVVSTMAGFSFSKIRWRFSGTVYYFILAWLALPPVVLIVPIYIEMVELHLINTYFSVILLYTAFNIPFNTFLMTAFFRALPDDLIEAARLDGASPNQVFLHVLVPLAKPALGTLAIFNILYAWNEFIFALLLLSSNGVKTLTVGVLQLQGRYTTDYPVIMAGLLVASIPVVIAYLFFQKYLIRGIVSGAVR